MAKRRSTTGKRKKTNTSRTTSVRKTIKPESVPHSKSPREHRRKGIPTRSPSRDDPRKGIVFSFVTLSNLDTVVRIIRRPSDFESLEPHSLTTTTSSQLVRTEIPLEEIPETSNMISTKRNVSFPQAVY
ncbi:hypothetical protein K7432_010897 [Basidiobolus ranarum]|uniref:Uncharacterized protein n=1 Tax=Basidiobolus ranarum TaxID=34480 RepID=A0ABR2VV98_9FUNG